MTGREMQIAFERQIQAISGVFKTDLKPTSDNTFYFLNLAQDTIIDDLYSAGVEINSEIEAKLKNLFKHGEVDLSLLTPSGMYSVDNGIEFDLASDVRYILNEYVIETTTSIPVKNVSNDYFNLNIRNPFKQPKQGELCWSLNSDKKRVLIYPVTLDEYRYTYIKTPVLITKDNSSELNESAHKDIVNRAVQIFIERSALGSKNNQ